MNLDELSKEELLERLRGLLDADRQRESDQIAIDDTHERILHELQVHQIELEVQNRSLRESQEALEASQSRYAELYDFAPIAYLTLDTKGCLQEINLTGATLIGRERAQLLGKPFLSVVSMEAPATLWNHLRRCVETRAPVVSELRLATIRAGAIDAQVVSTPVLDAEGRATAYHTTLTDISERKRAERELARLNQRLQEAVHAREDLLAVVAHDLRNPLAAIQFAAAILRAGAPASGDRRRSRKQIDAILRNVGAMTGLIDDLLAASTIEAGHFTVEAVPEDVRPIVEEAIQQLSPAAAARSLRLEQELEAALSEALCDRPRIVQVLSNLLGNAIKFTEAGGVIRVRATLRGGEVCLSVADTGRGIPEGEVPHLFERYWHGKPGERQGTGLGLYIVKGIVEAHGGTIWVESKVGEGTTFFFTLRVVVAG